ncbi:MAG: zinc-ribbon domain-containing protein [Deltaproteobacteria bacterium]|nr:zinc-ribbon domain-containing protein [Deltaproteobacteria bacterium]MBI3391410.1 zinc-ribbon domain-containing protein [Deltaproteobacteria bacterium]
MVIQCPYCATRFQLDDTKLTAAHPMLKCSRCRHIFPGPSTSTTPPQPPPKPSVVDTPENLSFTFSEQPAKEPSAPARDLTIDEPEPEFELGTDAAPSTRHRETASPTSHSFAEEEEDEAPAVTRSANESLDISRDDDLDFNEPERPTTRIAREELEEDEQAAADVSDEFDEPFEEERVMPRGISVRPVVIFLGLVVAAYAVIAWTLRANVVLADSLFHKLPFISSLTEDRLLNRKLVLSDVTGGYQRIKDGQTVFVITGRALNNATVTVRNVQIVGRLYSRDDAQLDEKSIFCGNVISMKILKSLTQREVSILEDLKPPKRFGIAPGEESIFVIVFMQPPNGVTEFSSQVVAAQRQA